MKRLLGTVILTVIAICIFQACDSSDDPQPVKEVKPMFNEQDSLTYLKLLAAADYNIEKGLTLPVPDDKKQQPEYVETFGFTKVKWKWFDDIKQYRITEIMLQGNDENICSATIPDCIEDLDSLSFLDIAGPAYTGSLPATVANLKKMKILQIRRTSLIELPDEIFTADWPYLEELTVCFNSYMTKLPDAITGLPYADKERYIAYSLQSNGFTGTCPLNINRQVLLNDNNFRDVDWESLRDVDGESLFGFPPAGPVLYENGLKLTIPDWVLADTLKTLHVWRIFLGPEITKVNKLINLPTADELRKMQREYCADHPEKREKMPELFRNH